MKSNFLQYFIEKKYLHKKTKYLDQFYHFKRSNPTLINTEHAKYKEKFSQVNSPTKGADELKFVTTVVHGSLQDKSYANLKYHLI